MLSFYPCEHLQGKQPGTDDLRKRRQAAGGRMQVCGRVRRLPARKGWSVEEVFFCFTRLVTTGENRQRDGVHYLFLPHIGL